MTDGTRLVHWEYMRRGETLALGERANWAWAVVNQDDEILMTFGRRDEAEQWLALHQAAAEQEDGE